MKQFIYGVKYVLSYRFLGKKRLLICGLVMHNKCYLRCHHCRVIDCDNEIINYEVAARIIDTFYKNSGRTSYFEGGEPFSW